MSSPASLITPTFSPLAWAGRLGIGVVTYLGAFGLLVVASFRQFLSRGWVRPTLSELSWMVLMGVPLSGLVHTGLGSFLAMQAYYGGTFVDGTGAVVGVGLFRNVAPLMAGVTMAGLICARVTPELRRLTAPPRPRPRGRFQLDAPPTEIAPESVPPQEHSAESPERLALPRIAAAMAAGPVAGLAGAGMGTFVGWKVATGLMGVSTHSFFLMFWDMLWLRDVVGLFLKGIAFGLVAAAFACHEGLRGSPGDADDATPNAAFRAVCLSLMTIMLLNGSWFVLVYHAGPAFGPTLLKPPSA